MMVHEIGVRKRAEDRSSAARNCKSSDALCVPHPSRRYTSWEVPGRYRKNKKKREGNAKKVSMFFIHIIIDTYLTCCFCVAKGFMYMYMYQKNEKKKEEDCLSTSPSSSSLHFSTYTQPNHKQILPRIFSFFLLPPQIFYEKNYATGRPRDLQFAQGPFFFLCIHT